MYALGGAGHLGDDLALLAGFRIYLRLGADIAVHHRHRGGQHGPHGLLVAEVHLRLPVAVGLAAGLAAGGVDGIGGRRGSLLRLGGEEQ